MRTTLVDRARRYGTRASQRSGAAQAGLVSAGAMW
jgi:hypothetical protein